MAPDRAAHAAAAAVAIPATAAAAEGRRDWGKDDAAPKTRRSRSFEKLPDTEYFMVIL